MFDSSELTRRIVKEELTKLNSHDMAKLKNDLDVMKTEIRALKNNAVRSGAENAKQIEEL